MPAKSTKASEHGFGLLEVIIAAGIFAIIAAAMSNNSVFSINAQRALELQGDKEAFKKRILEHYSCYSTNLVPSTKCTSLGRIDLEDTYGDILLPISGKTIGSWTYVAQCVTPTGGINIRAVRFIENMFTDPLNKDLDHLDPNADVTLKQNYVKDPLTKKAVTINDPESFLFPASKPLCDGNYPQKLVPFYGHYRPKAPGTSHQENVKGKPLIVTVFSPEYPFPKASYCTKIIDMNLNQHACGTYEDPTGNYDIVLGPTYFTVSKDLLTLPPNARLGSYPEWVYFGFKDVAN